MNLFFAMLPYYLLGNVHCMGMCGPLAATLGRHRYRLYYFIGRLSSFSFAGFIAGEGGYVVNSLLAEFHIAALVSLAFGAGIIVLGICWLTGRSPPGEAMFARLMQPTNHAFTLLLLRDLPLSTYLFGFFTIFLPCGQSLVVFAACALSGSAAAGLFNGFAFALLTSPSLFLAMHSLNWIARSRVMNRLLGVVTVLIGILSLLRGFADLAIIDHFTLGKSPYHLVIF